MICFYGVFDLLSMLSWLNNTHNLMQISMDKTYFELCLSINEVRLVSNFPILNKEEILF